MGAMVKDNGDSGGGRGEAEGTLPRRYRPSPHEAALISGCVRVQNVIQSLQADERNLIGPAMLDLIRAGASSSQTLGRLTGGSAMQVTYRFNCQDVSTRDLEELVDAAELGGRVGEKIRRAFLNSSLVCFAYDNARLICASRAITDGEYHGVIYDVAVLPRVPEPWHRPMHDAGATRSVAGLASDARRRFRCSEVLSQGRIR